MIPGHSKIQQPPSLTLQSHTANADGWAHHTSKDGKTFWHNIKTGKSTWDKPDCLKTELELLMASQTPWKEYVSADGRPYWYNKETRKSVWECPDEIKLLKQELGDEWTHFTDKSVATERLKTLFKLKSVGLRTKWEEGLTAIKADSRFAFLNCLSTGEKKQAFAEYQNQLQKQQRDRDRIRKIEGRKMFLESLGKWPSITPASLLSDFEEAFKSEWWITCFSPSERDDLFNEFIEEWEPSYWEEYKATRKNQRLAILDFLRSSPKISTDLTWKEVAEILLQQEELKGAEPKDYLNCWEEFLLETEREDKERLGSQLQRCRKKRRQAFRDLIHKSIEDGSLNARVSFCDFIGEHRHDPAYLGIVGVPIATPREIFEAETEPLVESYEAQKQILKAVLKSNDIRLRSTTTYEEFLQLLESSEEAKQISDTNARLFYDSLKRRAVRREKRHSSDRYDKARQRSENGDDEKSRKTEFKNNNKAKSDGRRPRQAPSGESNARDSSNECISYRSSSKRDYQRHKDQEESTAAPASPDESNGGPHASQRPKRSRKPDVLDEGEDAFCKTSKTLAISDNEADDSSKPQRKKVKNHYDRQSSSSLRS